MKLLADEGVDRQVVDRLRADGHEVEYVAEATAGAPDAEVLDRANVASAVLLTADKDFGELVFRQRRASGGVLLVRLAGLVPDRKAAIVAALVRERAAELNGNFTVITPSSARVRRPR